MPRHIVTKNSYIRRLPRIGFCPVAKFSIRIAAGLHLQAVNIMFT